MELEGTVHGGVIVPDDAAALPEGTRVRISPVPGDQPGAAEDPEPRFAALLGFAADLPGAPSDLAAQHDHYLTGEPKR